VTSTDPTNPSSWSSFQAQASLGAVSCPSTSLCVAVGANGVAFELDQPIGWGVVVAGGDH